MPCKRTSTVWRKSPTIARSCAPLRGFSSDSDLTSACSMRTGVRKRRRRSRLPANGRSTPYVAATTPSRLPTSAAFGGDTNQRSSQRLRERGPLELRQSDVAALWLDIAVEKCGELRHHVIVDIVFRGDDVHVSEALADPHLEPAVDIAESREGRVGI